MHSPIQRRPEAGIIKTTRTQVKRERAELGSSMKILRRWDLRLPKAPPGSWQLSWVGDERGSGDLAEREKGVST